MGKAKFSETGQLPMRFFGAGKRGVRTQFGALCYRRREGEVEVLLVTSRTRGRWTIPKGWPVRGATPAASARREAWEEAGAKGRVLPVCLGVYSYFKRRPGLPCVVAVFPLRVERLADKFPEARQRTRRWVSLEEAAGMVYAPELQRLLQNFDPAPHEAAHDVAPD